MARPRLHDPDAVLDAAESLAAEAGPAAVTIRAVAASAGVSNGAIYHSFGSRAALVARTWLRAAHRFLAMQTESVESALATGDPTDAVVAAADALAVFADRSPQSARLLSTVSRDQLIGADLPADLAAELMATDRVLVDLMIRLARATWDRGDAAAVDVITTCVVDLPTAILLARRRLDDATARTQLREAVGAVLAVGPPARRQSRSQRR
ncbi:TetR/AcrR family transcriptional regulator [Mycolicibacterium sediminis]|nr:TetR/AcrR family transcriptional regulator [Mycolicibacterium sediminis]